MKTFNKKFAFALAAGLLLISGLAFAGHRHFDSDEWRAGYVVRHLDRVLDLSEAQEQQAATIAENFMQARRELHQKQRQSFADVWTQEQLQADEVLALMDGKKTVRDEMRRLMAESAVELHGILTPQQRTAFAKEKKFLRFMSGGHRGHREHIRHGWRGHDDHDGHDDDDDDHRGGHN